MSWTMKQAPSQSGRIAVVTGANIGLGYETALALAGKGCTVVLACRNAAKADAARAAILAQHPKARIECLTLDLGSLKSVRAFAAAYKKRHATLDLLINNAGIMMPPYTLSEDGFESQLAANYLGHFALTGLLLPLIIKTPNARIVSLSSLAHKWSGIRFHDLNATRRYDKRLAYGQSKLACLMFAYELQRRLTRAGCATLSVAAHPGVSATNLFQHLPKAVQLFAPLTELVFQSASGGAQPTLYAASGRRHPGRRLLRSAVPRRDARGARQGGLQPPLARRSGGGQAVGGVARADGRAVSGMKRWMGPPMRPGPSDIRS
jgi:NAD(P)-dependent dehydrogenase (short-subunit alcohol dehydrogenase family)